MTVLYVDKLWWVWFGMVMVVVKFQSFSFIHINHEGVLNQPLNMGTSQEQDVGAFY